jgi:hypothetical protein
MSNICEATSAYCSVVVMMILILLKKRLCQRVEVVKALLLLKTRAEQSFSSLHSLEFLADRSRADTTDIVNILRLVHYFNCYACGTD